VRHARVDVGVEAVLAGRGLVPVRVRLLVGERDAPDRFDRLEAVPVVVINCVREDAPSVVR
jgi:hypothetical protein